MQLKNFVFFIPNRMGKVRTSSFSLSRISKGSTNAETQKKHIKKIVEFHEGEISQEFISAQHNPTKKILTRGIFLAENFRKQLL
ncbi:MAG: hypothetical protein FDW93_02850 [Bergeyella sp.]|nr:hypothetical protein [Bergeyella sp.]